MHQSLPYSSMFSPCVKFSSRPIARKFYSVKFSHEPFIILKFPNTQHIKCLNNKSPLFGDNLLYPSFLNQQANVIPWSLGNLEDNNSLWDIYEMSWRVWCQFRMINCLVSILWSTVSLVWIHTSCIRNDIVACNSCILGINPLSSMTCKTFNHCTLY